MSWAGAARRENVGTSNHKSDGKSDHRKPKVSLAMKINQGLGGPKANPKGVADGQPVNIPALLYLFLKATESWRRRALLDLLFRALFQNQKQIPIFSFDFETGARKKFWSRPEQLFQALFLEKL